MNNYALIDKSGKTKATTEARDKHYASLASRPTPKARCCFRGESHARYRSH